MISHSIPSYEIHTVLMQPNSQTHTYDLISSSSSWLEYPSLLIPCPTELEGEKSRIFLPII